MKIEMTVADSADALSELWVQAMSDQLLDLPRTIAAFDDEQRQLFAQYNPIPVAWYDGASVDPDEDHGFAFSDWFVFTKESA